MWRRQKGESLTLTRLINGLVRCSQQKKLSGCASNLLAHEDLGHFEEAHHRNIQAKFYNEKFPLVYESDNICDSLYEEHGATLKHECGKG